MGATIVLLIVLTLTACGKDNPTTQATLSSLSTTQAANTTAATQTQSSSSGLTWDDMPVYSGASQMQKGSWAVPTSENEDYSHFEWRYYEVNAATDDVSSFYKSKMPSAGWKEMGWMDAQETSWGMYNKNNENDAAMVWVSTQEDKTIIAMWRGSK